ncbi:hypothetical protein ACIRRA_15700 [Nocardia sp. NPDC101769]|uniref:hypothetical protein n=1 Tax=Nocardia sp. NPDC101769 TaxID=3364333 RepID=UPI00382026B6
MKRYTRYACGGNALYEPLPDRWMVEIGEYARIDYQHLWGWPAEPVRYTSLKELGISLDDPKLGRRPAAPPSAA